MRMEDPGIDGSATICMPPERRAATSCGVRGRDLRRSFCRRFWNHICRAVRISVCRAYSERVRAVGASYLAVDLPGPPSRSTTRVLQCPDALSCRASGCRGTRLLIWPCLQLCTGRSPISHCLQPRVSLRRELQSSELELHPGRGFLTGSFSSCFWGASEGQP